jgi:bifunctional non-homologous end joining protein LigD
MLARSGPIPSRGRWAFEVKWDGFRALVSTRPFCVRSRRGWDMAPLLPEFAELRPHGVYDAELVAFGEDGRPISCASASACCTATNPSRLP